MTEEEWDDFEGKILDEVNPGGWEGFLFGNPYWGVTLDEKGELKLLQIQEAGLNPAPLLKLLGVGGKALSASGAALKAAAGCPPRRAPRSPPAACCRASPGSSRRCRRRRPGTALGELDALGRTTGASATITREMLNTGTARLALDQARGLPRRQRQPRPRASDLAPAGRQRHATRATSRRSIQNPVNTPVMRGFEAAGGQRRPRR